jgi:6-phosphogluconolactonase
MTDMSLPGQVLVVSDVADAFAQLVCDRVPRSIALSGGETAEDCYAALAGQPFDWREVDVYFGDDRVVPVDDPDSNEGMVRRTLFAHEVPRAIHSMVAAGAEAYDALVRSAPPIDLVHLGLGPDGHTASLFPGSAACDEQSRFVVESEDAEHPHPRLTFTFPAIARSRLAVVTVVGAAKHDAIARIRAGEDLPGARIRAEAVLWLGDRDALGPG